MFKGLMSDIENTFAEGWFKDWWRNMPIEIAVPGAGGGPPSPGRTLTGPAGGQPGGAPPPAPLGAAKAAPDRPITPARPGAPRPPPPAGAGPPPRAQPTTAAAATCP